MIQLGAFSVVVGSIITRPQLITRTFAEALEEIDEDALEKERDTV